MSEPDDKTLLEFVARFAGWTEIQSDVDGIIGGRRTQSREWIECLPDYLNSVDAWLRDVWPKVVNHSIAYEWVRWLKFYSGVLEPFMVNASARYRCLALWRAIDGNPPTP